MDSLFPAISFYAWIGLFVSRSFVLTFPMTFVITLVNWVYYTYIMKFFLFICQLPEELLQKSFLLFFYKSLFSPLASYILLFKALLSVPIPMTSKKDLTRITDSMRPIFLQYKFNSFHYYISISRNNARFVNIYGIKSRPFCSACIHLTALPAS